MQPQHEPFPLGPLISSYVSQAPAPHLPPLSGLPWPPQGSGEGKRLLSTVHRHPACALPDYLPPTDSLHVYLNLISILSLGALQGRGHIWESLRPPWCQAWSWPRTSHIISICPFAARLCHGFLSIASVRLTNGWEGASISVSSILPSSHASVCSLKSYGAPLCVRHRAR